MNSGGLGLQWLEAGPQFPDQRLKPGHSRDSTESSPPDHEGQWLVTRPWLVCFGEMNFNKETESSKTSKVFIRREKVPVNRHRPAGSERESRFVVVRMIGVPEEEEKKKGSEKIFEEIIVENFLNMGKEIVDRKSVV